jgi:4-hydroxybenzoate polyprenyltransferase
MKTILGLIRWKDWYDSKPPLFFFAYYYLLLTYNVVDMQHLFSLIFLGIFYLSFFSFGYMLNDYFDQPTDRIAGKESVLSTLVDWQQILVLSIPFFLGIIVLMPFRQHQMAMIMLVLSYLFAVLYSAPPFRLKTRGTLGVAGASLGQRVFPLLVVFSVFEHFGLDTIILVALSFMIGVRWILIHQLLDRENDLHACLQTYASSQPLEKTHKLVRFAFAIEIALVLLFFGAVMPELPALLPLGICYLLFELYLMPLWRKLRIGKILYSYEYAPLADFYFLWLPLGLSILLGWKDLMFLFIVALEILWKMNYLRFDISLIRLRRSKL